jgi:DNA-binding MarR family transcriptional regulator
VQNTDPDPDTLSAWTALLVAHRRLITQLDAQLRTGADMTLDEYDLLFQLRRGGHPLTMTELADQALVSRASTTRLVDRLVERGWVERRHDDQDRRRVMVQLTERGRRAQRVAGRLHLKGIAQLVGIPLAGHDVKALTAALRALGCGALDPR